MSNFFSVRRLPFEAEGEVIESGIRRTIEARDIVVRSLVRAVYRFRDATPNVEKKMTSATPCKICIENWNARKVWLGEERLCPSRNPLEMLIRMAVRRIGPYFFSS